MILFELGGAVGIQIPAFLILVKVSFISESAPLEITPGGGQSERKTLESLRE